MGLNLKSLIKTVAPVALGALALGPRPRHESSFS